jgi:sulfur-oxidizing protein SoxZ
MPDARIRIASGARRGEAVEVQIAIRHAMETGYRRDEMGQAIPRNCIRSFTCTYNGTVVLAAKIDSGIAANPYFRFFVTAVDTGELVFEWADDAGVRGSERATLTVA